MEIKVKITKKDMMDEKTRQNLAEILSSCYKVICEQTKQDLPKMKTKEKKEKQAQEETKELQDPPQDQQEQEEQEQQEQDTDEQAQYTLKELRELARKKAQTIEKGQKKVMAVIEKYTQGAETNIVNIKKRDYNAVFQDLEGLE